MNKARWIEVRAAVKQATREFFEPLTWLARTLFGKVTPLTIAGTLGALFAGWILFLLCAVAIEL